jgi:predicted kinase
VQTWEQLSTAAPAEILAWAEREPWARDMAGCQQDAMWHAEGDVWTHTKMVFAQAQQLDGWSSLSAIEHAKLLFTALFHDAGKASTTWLDPESGRVRSPKHALRSMEITRDALRELGCDLNVREEICNLVRYHGRPPFTFEKENPEREVISLSWLFQNRLLYLFALADTRGRKAGETSRPEETLHLWKLLGEEHDCFETPYRFANDHARFLFFRDELSSLHYTPHEKFKCNVTMMCGLPGAGKDTWLARHAPDLPVVSLDSIRTALEIDATDEQGSVIQAAREQCREYLRAGRDFAFNATNVTRQTRRRWIDLFHDYSARIEIVYIEPPLDTIRQQNKNRPDPVPEQVIARLVAKLEPPQISEAHHVRLIAPKF